MDLWFEVDGQDRTDEQKANATIMYKQREEMEDLVENTVDSPELWSGYNYGTTENPRYITGKIIFIPFCIVDFNIRSFQMHKQ